MKTRLLGGIAALVVAIIGTIILFNYVQGADKRALGNTETEEVLVVKTDIPAGTPASKLSEYLESKSLPKSAVAAETLTSLSDIGTKVTSVELLQGEQLISSRLVDSTAYLGPARVEVPAGKQEVSIRLPIDRVAGGRIQAGDTAGVFLSIPKTDTTPDRTQLTFHKVLVTAVQYSSGQAAQTQGEAQQSSGGGALSSSKSSSSSANDTYLMTIAVSAADAQRIVYAVEFGKVYFSKETSASVEDSSGVVDSTKVLK
ncbi:Flp pilus assembly protein CpaB [Pseudarthrobacter sp. J1738]|uniref:Flp pilus assembly protein CpaB n=1 Tax=unclassified Pseudarthrobacter TaxID=2647000 RepID=UPI003D265CEE